MRTRAADGIQIGPEGVLIYGYGYGGEAIFLVGGGAEGYYAEAEGGQEGEVKRQVQVQISRKEDL